MGGGGRLVGVCGETRGGLLGAGAEAFSMSLNH